MTTSLQPIQIYEPLAEYLGNGPELRRFEITELDVGRLSGHLCPSMIGAYQMCALAITELFKDQDGVCERGQLSIDLGASESEGATGPMANVMSYITGAWGPTGFGGIRGKYSRRDLLHFEVPSVPKGYVKFTRRDTQAQITLSYSYDEKKVLLLS